MWSVCIKNVGCGVYLLLVALWLTVLCGYCDGSTVGTYAYHCSKYFFDEFCFNTSSLGYEYSHGSLSNFVVL